MRAYIGAICKDVASTEDLTHEFFLKTFPKVLKRANPTRPFRPYLKQAIRFYLRDTGRRTSRQPLFTRPDAPDHAGWDALVRDRAEDAEAAYHRAWARQVMREALNQVEALCTARDQQLHFAIFRARHLGNEPTPPSWSETGAPFHLDGKAAENRAATVGRHLRRVLLELLTPDTGSAASAREELANLHTLL